MFYCDAFWDPQLSPLSPTARHDPSWKHPGAHVARFAPYSGSGVLFTAVIQQLTDSRCSALRGVVGVGQAHIHHTGWWKSVAVSPPP